MNIIHYFLGPERAGGLNRYARDLASEQAAAGHTVSLLFPAGSLWPRRKATIRRCGKFGQIQCHQLSGGVPIPLLEGVRRPEMILSPRSHGLSEEELSRFCGHTAPDILHIHTWMGFPPELLAEMKKRGVRVIFTTHDYFGLCPKVNFINSAGALCRTPDNAACSRCNANAPGERFLALRNLAWLFRIKHWLSPLLRIRKRKTASTATDDVTVRDYDSLRRYYCEMLASCDRIHFNSAVTQGEYARFLPALKGEVVAITHAGIRDLRKTRTIRNAVGTVIRLALLGGTASYKGFPLLKRVLTQLEKDGVRNWRLTVYGSSECGNDADSTRIIYGGRYREADLDRIFGVTDLLVVPSVCYETFGFVVPEALSRGVPVMVSSTVGARSLVEKIAPGFVVPEESAWREKLSEIFADPGILTEFNGTLCRMPWQDGMAEHEGKMEEFYRKAIQGKLQEK